MHNHAGEARLPSSFIRALVGALIAFVLPPTALSAKRLSLIPDAGKEPIEGLGLRFW